MRILLLGANGQLGYELLRTLAGVAQDPNPHPCPSPEGGGVQSFSPLPSGAAAILGQELRGGAQRRVRVRTCEIISATREGQLEDGTRCKPIDLSDLENLRAALDRLTPDLIVNAAAYTAVDRAEDEPERAQRINGEAVGVLGAWAAAHDAHVLHYSTDYVFDGSATRPYRESDTTNPASVYGRTKLAGEIALRESGARHLILRTAWVYAARGHNFLRTMLRLASERETLRVVDDQTGAPTSAGLLADATAQIIAHWCADDDAEDVALDGTYHIGASGQTSWYGFARSIFERAQHAGLLTRVPLVVPIKSEDFSSKAKRPAYSVLDTTKLREDFAVELPDWQAGLDAVIAELAPR